jgi:cytochrome c
MKKMIVSMMSVLALSACGPNYEEMIAEGEQLVNKSDCNTCHHKTGNIVGPSHLAVAEKYEFDEANTKILAERIIKGGAGIWGDIPMTAHTDLSVDDAEKMAMYILSLDGEKPH